MSIKTFTPEQIVGKLRQIEVLVSQSKTVRLACKEPTLDGDGRTSRKCLLRAGAVPPTKLSAEADT